MEPQSLPKRFYKDVSVEAGGDGAWLIALDGRNAKTNGQNLLSTPVRPLADALANEWREQEGVINPSAMPLTRRRMIVIDRGEIDQSNWSDLVVSYLSSDLLCYRADRPQDLVTQQENVWSEYLRWIADEFDINLSITAGIVSIPQPPEATSKAVSLLKSATTDELSCLAAATEISGSAVLAIGLWRRFKTPEEILAASRLDETYQAEKWGMDAEAVEKEQRLHGDFLDVARYLSLIRSG